MFGKLSLKKCICLRLATCVGNNKYAKIQIVAKSKFFACKTKDIDCIEKN